MLLRIEKTPRRSDARRKCRIRHGFARTYRTRVHGQRPLSSLPWRQTEQRRGNSRTGNQTETRTHGRRKRRAREHLKRTRPQNRGKVAGRQNGTRRRELQKRRSHNRPRRLSRRRRPARRENQRTFRQTEHSHNGHRRNNRQSLRQRRACALLPCRKQNLLLEDLFCLYGFTP